MSKRRRIWIACLAVVAVLAAFGAGLSVFLSKSNAQRVKDFKKSAEDNWAQISEQATALGDSIERVGSTSDLDVVAETAGDMVRQLATVSESLDGLEPPAGYGEIAEMQKRSIEDLESYVEKVEELASRKDQEVIQDNQGILDSRSRKAFSSVSEFLSQADFLAVSIPIDFYQAGSGLLNAWKAPYAEEARTKAVYDTVNAFMTADIKESSYDKVWEMLSTRLRTGLEYYNITGERFESSWRGGWKTDKPVDFFVNRRDITFSDQSTANAKVIAYLERGAPRVETLRLVSENGVWKIDSDPFVGFL